MTAAEIVFFASVAALAYTFGGYGLVLWAWSRLAPRPVRQAPIEPEVAIIVVVHNGLAHVGPKIASCLAQDYPAGKLAMVVASDGSDDGTPAAVERLGDARVRLLAFPERRGKAACLGEAAAACTEPILVFTDVRQPLHPAAVRSLARNFADPEVGAVCGRLEFLREGMSDFGEGIGAYWKYEQFLRRASSRVHSTVGVTGALYAIRRECLGEVPADTILDDMLVPMRVVMQGRRVVFEEGAVIFDHPSSDARRERARKVRTLAGNFQLFARHPEFLAPWRDPIAFQVISHKVMRLVAPAALVAALASNVALAANGPVYVATLALQAAGYALAAVGALVPPARRLKPVKLAMVFLSLNWFVVLGFVEYLSNRRAHLWKNVPARTDDSRASP